GLGATRRRGGHASALPRPARAPGAGRMNAPGIQGAAGRRKKHSRRMATGEGTMRHVARLLAFPLAALLAVASCGLPAPGGGVPQPTGPIRVGLLAPITGTTAASGTDMLNGWNLYWKVNGNKIGAREVQTFHEDTGGD